MSAPTTFLLLRHAEVDARYQQVFAGGRIDMDLSPRGHEQAALLAKHLHRKPFDVLYASPMKRVHQTLAPLLAERPCQPIVLDGLREVDFGDWTSLGWEQVKEKYNASAFEWLHRLETGGIPNAESDPAYRGRVGLCVQQILRDHPGQTVAVACHGGTIRMILSILLGAPLSRMALYEIDYASLTQVRYLEDKVQVQLLNFTPWRDAA